MPLVSYAMKRVSNNLPKMLSPRAHAVADYATAGMFLLMGSAWFKHNKRASIAAFAVAGSSIATSLCTAYPGGVWHRIDFKSHGKIDVGLASLMAALPSFMDFADDMEAKYFRSMGVMETLIAGMTDYDAVEEPQPVRGIRDRVTEED